MANGGPALEEVNWEGKSTVCTLKSTPYPLFTVEL